jgi:hypothetical protein
LGILLAGMLWGQVASAQVATNYAQEDLFFAGTVAGTYADTYANDDGCEALTEITNSRYSYLEHKWRFDVSGGTTVIFNVVACRPNNSDGDNLFSRGRPTARHTTIY